MSMINWTDTVEACLEHDRDPDSHTETDPYVFHASQIGYCKRQAYLSKLGLKQINTPTLGTFAVGTIIHEYLEERVPKIHNDVIMELPIESEVSGINFIGHSDCVQYDDDKTYVFDFKTRASFYKFNPPYDRHLDQLKIYMDAVDADGGKIVYLSKKKLVHEQDDGNWWVEEYPPSGVVEPDRERVEELASKAHDIAEPIATKGLPHGPQDIPFEPCGCWICNHETIDIEAFYG